MKVKTSEVFLKHGILSQKEHDALVKQLEDFKKDLAEGKVPNLDENSKEVESADLKINQEIKKQNSESASKTKEEQEKKEEKSENIQISQETIFDLEKQEKGKEQTKENSDEKVYKNNESKSEIEAHNETKTQEKTEKPNKKNQDNKGGK